MDNIKVFVVTGCMWLDGGRGMGNEYGREEILATVATLDEGLDLLRNRGYGKGRVVELLNGAAVGNEYLWNRVDEKRARERAAVNARRRARYAAQKAAVRR